MKYEKWCISVYSQLLYLGEMRMRVDASLLATSSQTSKISHELSLKFEPAKYWWELAVIHERELQFSRQLSSSFDMAFNPLQILVQVAPQSWKLKLANFFSLATFGQ